MNNKVIGVGDTIETPSEIIAGQQVNPEPMPTSTPPVGDELAAIEVTETDISCISLPEIETLQMTLGSLRPMQGYTPLPDIPKMQVRNQTNGVSDLLSERIMKESNQISISCIQRGVNVINPLSLPMLRAGDVSAGAVDVAKITALYFTNNGPSIATPGTAKRAAVEQSMQSMRSQIINAFNRDIPFSSMSPAERALALKSYECELLKIQLFMQAIDVLRGYANFQAKMNIPLESEWGDTVFTTDAYVALTALYNAVADLPVFDFSAHDRLEKLGRIYTAAKRTAVPGTCLFQDAFIAEDHYKEGVTLTGTGGYSAQQCSLNQIIPNLSMSTIWSMIRTGDFLELAQYYTKKAQNIRTQYEMVITALAQMTSKKALATKCFSEYIPAQPNEFGAMVFGSAEPVFSYAFHERMEYAPQWVVEEAGSGGGTVSGMWTLFTLPENDASVAPSATIGIRPVGLKHGKRAWDVAELVDIGLFKTQSAADITTNGLFADRIAGSTINIVGGVVSCSESQLGNGSALCFDAVFGDFFAPGTFYRSGSGAMEMYFWETDIYGMSMFSSGTGIHNCLPVLAKIAANTISTGVYGGIGNGFMFINYLTASENTQEVRIGEWLVQQIATAANFANILVPKDNAVGQRQIMYDLQAGYKDSGYYTMSIAAIDNAISKAYNTLVPFVQYTPRR